jgi:hypothetical protein
LGHFESKKAVMATRQKCDSSQVKETVQKQRTDKPTQQSPVVLTGQAELAMLQRAIAKVYGRHQQCQG